MEPAWTDPELLREVYEGFFLFLAWTFVGAASILTLLFVVLLWLEGPSSRRRAHTESRNASSLREPKVWPSTWSFRTRSSH